MLKLSISLRLRLFNSNKRNCKKNDSSPLLLAEADSLLRSLVGLRAKSTIDNYHTALRVFFRYAGTDLTMNRIDARLLEGFQQWLSERGTSQNTISCYMRSLRSLLNQLSPALKHQDLFDTVYTGKMRTDKRSIPMEDIARLRQLDIPPRSSLAFSRDLFLFCFYALGMPFVDAAFLRKHQIKDGYIVYHRHKTGQRIRVRMEAPMWQIVQRYSKEDSDYVFPILRFSGNCPVMRVYANALSRYNRHLGQLGKMAGIKRHLTSYVARHSWASSAYHANVDLSVISKALGHSSPNMTLTYIREIDDNRIDEANQELLQRIMG